MTTRPSKLLICIFVLIIAPLLMADIGMKPTADFAIVYEIDPIPELSGYALFTCYQSDCSDAKQLAQGGPQHFECTQYECESLAYSYADYMFVQLDFSDGTSRSSNIVTKVYFNSNFEITVAQDELILKEIVGNNIGKPTPYTDNAAPEDNTASNGTSGDLPLPIPPLGLITIICAGAGLLIIVALIVIVTKRNRKE